MRPTCRMRRMTFPSLALRTMSHGVFWRILAHFGVFLDEQKRIQAADSGFVALTSFLPVSIAEEADMGSEWVQVSLHLTERQGAFEARVESLYRHLNADLHDEQARIGKISILYGEPKPYYERALQTHKRHNRQHGYPMFIQRENVLDGFWTKPAFIHYMILRELRKPESQRLEWLFWFDADTIILNYNVPLEIFLPPPGDEALKRINVLIADDWNGLNNGIFGVRVSRYSAILFAGILAFRDFEPDTYLTFADQSAMEFLLKKRNSVNHVAKVPQRWFNAYATEDADAGPSWVHPGDLLVHFAGVSDREKQMNIWADRSESMDYKWNTPLANTKYIEDIERFWNRTKSVHEARMNLWNKGIEHLRASYSSANETITQWGSTSEKESQHFKSMEQAESKAAQFLGGIQKYQDEIIKEDLHQIEKVIKDLDDVRFSLFL
ncbi:hypothetical protein E4U21_004112 [Claviceps maximensis]|nr:hypothetical protein E4U21_004112 [Claviceps maximensis]